MARKGNKIISTWNVAFTKLQQGSAFKDYCTASNAKHGECHSAVEITNTKYKKSY